MLGQMKTDMSRGGLDQLSRAVKLNNGTVVTVRSMYGNDTINIQVPPPIEERAAEEIAEEARRYSVNAVAPPEINFDLVRVDPPARIAPSPPVAPIQQNQVVPDRIYRSPMMLGEEVEPPENNREDPEITPPTEEEIMLDTILEEVVYDEAIVLHTYWIVQRSSTHPNPFSIDEWSRTGGYTGRSVALTTGAMGVIIFAGYVWWAQFGPGGPGDSSGAIYRAALGTGAQEQIYTYSPSDSSSYTAASTITPTGVLFVIGYLDAKSVLFSSAGAAIYEANMGVTGPVITTFVNNGTNAFISSNLAADTQHTYSYSIDIASGAYAVNGGDYTPMGDSDSQGESGCMAGGALYGVRVENTGDLESQAYAYVRAPASNGSSILGSVGVGVDSRSAVYSSAAALSLNGTPVLATVYEMSVVDKTSGSLSSVSTSAFGVGNAGYDSVISRGTSVIPDGRQVAFMFFNGDAALRPIFGFFDLQSGAATAYDVGADAQGYLISYTVVPAVNPKETDLPLMLEWAYLSHTSVNP